MENCVLYLHGLYRKYINCVMYLPELNRKCIRVVLRKCFYTGGCMSCIVWML